MIDTCTLGAYPPRRGRNYGDVMAEHGYRVPDVTKIVGISYRQLDYWARTGLVRPSVKDAQGSGSQRLYSFQDLELLKLIKRMLDSGMNLR